MRVVCDTNILISALIFPGGSPDQILHFARLKEFELVLTPDIVSEFRRVISEKFKYNPEETDDFVERITSIAVLVYPQERLKIVERKDSDNRILEAAVASFADFLVTGDKKDLLPLGKIKQIPIITAAQFLQILKKQD